MSLNIDISIDGLLNLIRDVVPELERPLKYFILWSALALFLVPWIVLFFIIEELLPSTVGDRPSTLPEYAGGVSLMVIMVLLLVTAWMYKVRHQNAKSKSDTLIERMNTALESDDLEQDPRAVFEEILGDDKR